MLEDRLSRTIALLGEGKARLLFNSSVMVIGLGAVGGYALEMIARYGVKNITVVDFDCFEASNINRQILATVKTLGSKKTEVAKQRILDINPDANVNVIDMKIKQDNLDFILDVKPDFVVDAIDDLDAKSNLIEYLLKNDVKFVSAMGAALKFKPELLKLSNLDKTTNCHLAKKLRENLRKRNVNLKDVKVVFSTEDARIVKDKNGNNVLGSMAQVPMAMGAFIASYAFDVLINKEN